MTRPLLDGIRVLDFTQFQQGPSATVLLSDLGAEVIKVERLKVGDPSRHVGRREDGFSQYFHTHHRGKRSIAVDLRSDEGRDIVYEVVKRVDVVTENFKPGVMNRLGLGWDDLKQQNPKLVYASASGFGPRDPGPTQPPGLRLLGRPVAVCGPTASAATTARDPMRTWLRPIPIKPAG